MKTYEITEILPLYKRYEGVIIQPQIKNGSALYLLNNNELVDEQSDDINNFLDNEEDSFVERNMIHGKEAESYVKDRMTIKYGNCKKAEAREGYDFKVQIGDKTIKLEVKSLQGYSSPFHMTINEINNATSFPNDYFLCFVILPSIEKGVQDIKFLADPINSLGISIPVKKFDGLNKQCFIIPEKFLIKPIKGFVKSLPNEIIF